MKLIDEITNKINQYKKCYIENSYIKQDLLCELYNIKNKIDDYEDKINLIKIQIKNYQYIKYNDYLKYLNNLSYYTTNYNIYIDKYNLKKKELRKYINLMDFYINEIQTNEEKLKKIKKKEEYYNKNFLYVNLFRRCI